MSAPSSPRHDDNAARYVALVESIHRMYANLVLDTTEDQVLHERVVATADAALVLVKQNLGLPTTPPLVPGPVRDHAGSHPCGQPEDARPVLLSCDDIRLILAGLLTPTALANPESEAHRSRIITQLVTDLTEEKAQPSSRYYTYLVHGPWGSDCAASAELAIAEAVQARAEHRAAGYGRDERYYSIGATRTLTITLPDDSSWTGPTEPLPLPEPELSTAEAAADAERVHAAQDEQQALHQWLSAKMQTPATAGTSGGTDD